METQKIITDYKDIEISGEKLTNFLSDNDFFPYDVRDYGDIPHFYKYFPEYDITAYIIVQPLFNDHYPDTLPRKIAAIVFTNKKFDINIKRIEIAKLPEKLILNIKAKLAELFSEKTQ